MCTNVNDDSVDSIRESDLSPCSIMARRPDAVMMAWEDPQCRNKICVLVLLRHEKTSIAIEHQLTGCILTHLVQPKGTDLVHLHDRIAKKKVPSTRSATWARVEAAPLSGSAERS